MSMFNILVFEMNCPRCHMFHNFEGEMYFGNTNVQKTYRIGDMYDWVKGKAPQNGGEFLKANPYGTGYSECDLCKKDFYLKIGCSSKILSSLEVDYLRLPYIKDISTYRHMAGYGDIPVQIDLFNGYRICRFAHNNKMLYVNLRNNYSYGEEFVFEGQPYIPVFTYVDMK